MPDRHVSVSVMPFSGAATEWNTLAATAPGGTHCHLYGWREVIGRVHGHETPYLAARAPSGALAGILPLVHVSSLLFGRYLSSMPYLNYGGPIGSPEAVLALTDAAIGEGARRNVKLTELRSRTVQALPLPASQRKITVVLDLAGDGPKPVWDGLKAKVRSQIRRPMKEGVEVRFGADQVVPFHAVYARHMRDLGTPAQPLSLFTSIADVFRDQAWFGCAYLKDRAVACGAGLTFGGEFELVWASALSEHNAIAPNMLLYWAFIERAASEGLAAFNFGRCTPGSGTHRFKQQWGGRDEQLWWYQDRRGGVSATPNPSDPAYALGPRLWKRLPLSVATAVGPWIVRGIP